MATDKLINQSQGDDIIDALDDIATNLGNISYGEQTSSDKVVAMAGYQKASTSESITQADTLNEAVGKLEKKVDDNATDISDKVDGPNSATVGNIATFNNVNGKSIDDSGISVETSLDNTKDTEVPTSKAVDTYITDQGFAKGVSSSTANNLVTFNGTDGKTLKDSGITVAKSVTNDDTAVPTSKAVQTYAAPVSHTHSESDITDLGDYAGSNEKGGAATSANKLNIGNSNIGSATQPVYFDKSTGLPVAITNTIQSNVPANAVFTDTTYTVETGTANGKIKVTPSDDTAYEVPVYGLKAGAYTETTTSVTSGSSALVTSGGVHTALSDKVDKVTGKGLSSNDYTDDEKSKLAGIEAGAEVNVQADWSQTTSTADSYIKNKPTLGTAAAADTTDFATAAQGTKADNAIPSSTKGVANGVASLDANGKVPTAQLPSYVDDVLEYSAKSSFPAQGETGKIYVDTSDNKTYRWSGSAYVEISASLALGETSSTAYYGDKGKTAYEHSQVTSGNPHNVTKSDVGLGNVGNFLAVSTNANQGLSDTQKSNARANIGAGTGNGTYSKPSTGIPKTDLASAVQTSLGLADTSLQHTTLTGSPDLDTYLTTGVYHIATSAAAHAPTTNHATLFVDATVGTPYQIFKPDNVDSPWYTRHRSGSAWTSWVAMKFTDTTYSAATTSAAGLMSAADKTKLNGIATGAQVNSITGVKGNSESTYRTGNVNLTAANIGLGNVGNFKAVSTVASQGLSDTEKSNARANIGAGTSSLTLGTSSTQAAAGNHTHNYAGSSSAGGAATSANKLNTNAGSATQPVYFSKGVPVATTYTLGKSVPSDAKFTDTTYSVATTSANGLMSSSDKTVVNSLSKQTFTAVTVTGATSCTGGYIRFGKLCLLQLWFKKNRSAGSVSIASLPAPSSEAYVMGSIYDMIDEYVVVGGFKLITNEASSSILEADKSYAINLIYMAQ